MYWQCLQCLPAPLQFPANMYKAALKGNAFCMQHLLHNPRRCCVCLLTMITSSDRRRKKFRKFHTSIHEMNMSMLAELLCIVCKRLPPLPPNFNVGCKRKAVSELAKFLPLKRPPPAAHSQGQHLNIEIGGCRGPSLLLYVSLFASSHFTCEISSVVSHPPQRDSRNLRYTRKYTHADSRHTGIRTHHDLQDPRQSRLTATNPK